MKVSFPFPSEMATFNFFISYTEEFRHEIGTVHVSVSYCGMWNENICCFFKNKIRLAVTN